MVLNGHTVMFVYENHWRVVEVTETRYNDKGEITHITGHCLGRNAIRCFRVDKIKVVLNGCILDRGILAPAHETVQRLTY